jgi:hypothetical protein
VELNAALLLAVSSLLHQLQLKFSSNGKKQLSACLSTRPHCTVLQSLIEPSGEMLANNHPSLGKE